MATHKFRILARIFQALLFTPLVRLRPNLPEVTCLGNPPSSPPFQHPPSPPFHILARPPPLPFFPPCSESCSSYPRVHATVNPLSLFLSPSLSYSSLFGIVSLNHPPSPPRPPLRRGTPRRLSNCSTLRLNYLKPPFSPPLPPSN